MMTGLLPPLGIPASSEQFCCQRACMHAYKAKYNNETYNNFNVDACFVI